MTAESNPAESNPAVPDAPRLADRARPARPARSAWPVLTVAIAFGLFYVYDLLESISNMFGVAGLVAEQNKFRASVGAALVSVPWTLLIVGVAVPVVGFCIAALLGRKRSLGVRALLFLAGLTAVAAVSLSVTSLA